MIRRPSVNPTRTYSYKVMDRGTGRVIRTGKVKAKNEEYAVAKAMKKEGTTHPWDIMLENPKRGGNPMAKKRRPRKAKILGIPVMTVAILGGLAWWLAKKQ